MVWSSLGNTDKDVFDKYGLVWIVTDYAIEIDRLPITPTDPIA